MSDIFRVPGPQMRDLLTVRTDNQAPFAAPFWSGAGGAGYAKALLDPDGPPSMVAYPFSSYNGFNTYLHNSAYFNITAPVLGHTIHVFEHRGTLDPVDVGSFVATSPTTLFATPAYGQTGVYRYTARSENPYSHELSPDSNEIQVIVYLPVFSIAGSVVPALEGVTVTASDGVSTFTCVTDAQGNFATPSYLYGGSWTVAASMPGYTFSVPGSPVVLTTGSAFGVLINAYPMGGWSYLPS